MLDKHPVMSYKTLVIVVILLLIVMSITPSISVDTVYIEHANGKSPGDDTDWWPMFRHDPQHSGYSTSNAPDTNSILWSYLIGGSTYPSPAVVDSRVYIGSLDEVFCLDAITGHYIWSRSFGSWVYSSPAVVDSKVYICSWDSPVYCLDALTGSCIWRYSTGRRVESSPAVADSKVYIGSWDEKLHCLNADTGKFIWSYKTADRVDSSPAVADGKVYIGSLDEKVYCLDANTGDHIWSYKTGYRVDSSPAVADGKIYIGSDDHKLYCLDATTGDYIWSYKTGNWVKSSPAVADGKVYIGSYDGEVYAFGELDPDAPSAPEIDGPAEGVPHVVNNFTFRAESPVGNDLYYWIEWADGSNSGWLGPFDSGVEIIESHVWNARGKYPIQAKAKDTNGLVSGWGVLGLTIPRNRAIVNSFFQWILERFPLLERLLFLLNKI